MHHTTTVAYCQGSTTFPPNDSRQALEISFLVIQTITLVVPPPAENANRHACRREEQALVRCADLCIVKNPEVAVQVEK